MGNSISPCCGGLNSSSWAIKLIFWEGSTRTLTGKRVAGEIMFEFPDCMVCHADSFFIGHPIPALAIHDSLVAGQTYFVLPLDCFSSSTILSTSSLAALASSPSPSPSPNPNPNPNPIMNFKGCPFEYMKGSNGKVVIKVSPDFITKLIAGGKELSGPTSTSSTSPSHGFLCSTPELKKHYEQLVGSREQVWSPKLETISEVHKIRLSPCRFIGLEWKHKEYEG